MDKGIGLLVGLLGTAAAGAAAAMGGYLLNQANNNNRAEAFRAEGDGGDSFDDLDKLRNALAFKEELLRSHSRLCTPPDGLCSFFRDEEEEEEEETGPVQLKMALINARSANKFIRHGSSELSDLILHNGLDLLMVTETWLKLNYRTQGELAQALPPGYRYISDPRFGGRGGGLAIVFSPSLSSVTHVPFPTVPSTFQYLAASVRRRTTDRPVLVLNIYRPPNGNFRHFLMELLLLLSEVFERFGTVVIGGDFNIWVDRPESAEPRQFQTVLQDFGLIQHVSEQTHRAGHTLDLVLTRPDVTISDMFVTSNSFSDHSTVFFTAHVHGAKKKKLKRNRRN